jgi:hypothetical protein
VPQELLPAIVLGLAAALLAAGAVQASGCFPAAERPPALQGSVGRGAIALLLLALALLLAAGLWFAVARLSWPVAVIAAGLGLLAGPLLWQRLAPAGLDRPPGTLAIAALAASAASGLALWADAGRSS